LSLISGKQIHYLLPVLPAAALLIARNIGDAGTRPIEENAFPLIAAIAGAALLFTAGVARLSPGWLPPLHPAPGFLLLFSIVPLWRYRKSAWQVIPLTSGLVTIALLLECGLGALAAFDLRPVAALVDPSSPVAFAGKYEGELGFAARLTRPVEIVEVKDAAAWRAEHRNGYLIVRYKGSRPDFGAGAVADQPYDRARIGLWAPLGPD
jgi:hypothetical protein